MRKLEQLCLHYLECTINTQNVLEALCNASQLKLGVIKEFCLKYVVKDNNYSQIVMSREFENLERALMVEIIRRKQSPPVCCMAPPVCSSQPEHATEPAGNIFPFNFSHYML
jgi:leucine-zipper-like transcriptional regulator 1